MMPEDEYDLAGFTVGVVDKEKILSNDTMTVSYTHLTARPPRRLRLQKAQRPTALALSCAQQAWQHILSLIHIYCINDAARRAQEYFA